MGGLTNLLSQPHLLEQGLNNVASQVAQATTGASNGEIQVDGGDEGCLGRS